MKPKLIKKTLTLVFTGFFIAMPLMAEAHCDSMDGPVIKEAQAALETGKVFPLLKWVPEADEDFIKKLFEETLAVRKESAAARRLADTHFFETLVRVHRAGEGAPYTGIKPAGDISPALVLADKAIDNEDVSVLAKKIAAKVEEKIKADFAKVVEAKKKESQSIGDGREYVSAYVQYVHFVEGVHGSLSAGGHNH